MQLGHTIKFRSCLQQAFVVGDLETDRPILPLAPTQFNPCSSGSVISMQTFQAMHVTRWPCILMRTEPSLNATWKLWLNL